MQPRPFISKHTVKFRHTLVRMLAPTIYERSKLSSSLPRPMISFLKERFEHRCLSGIEIGVSHGENAENILETLKIERLFLVDPYIPYIDNDGPLITEHIDKFSLAKERLSKFGDKTVFILKTSMDALEEIPNNLDFVYIDGNHSYNFVKDDIEKYYDKVKVGGVIGGHDFDSRYCAVIKAVIEFAYTHKLDFNAKISDWWIIKK